MLPRVVVANYGKDGALRHYAYIERRLDAVDEWRQIQFRFKTDSAVHSTGLYIYNVKSKGALLCDDVRVEKIADASRATR